MLECYLRKRSDIYGKLHHTNCDEVALSKVLHRKLTIMPDGCSGDVNNNGTNTKCLNSSCIAGVVNSAAGKGVDNGGSISSTANILNLANGIGSSNNSGCHSPPRRVQVTAKILFGSVNAISDMKQNEKLQRKRSK